MDSLSKVSGGKLLVRGENIGIGAQDPKGRFHVIGDVIVEGPLSVSGAVGIGVPKVGTDVILDIGSRMRIRKGNRASAGIWFSQAPGDRAFVGMVNDNAIDFMAVIHWDGAFG